MNNKVEEAVSSVQSINDANIDELVNSSLNLESGDELEQTSSAVIDIPEPEAEPLEQENEAVAVMAAPEKKEQEVEEIPKLEVAESDIDESKNETETNSEAEPDTVVVEDVPVELSEDSELDNEQAEIKIPAQTATVQNLEKIESIEILENEVSELEAEIQLQMDTLVEKNDYLKANIQSELTRVTSDNEGLQQQVAKLEQQLSVAEEKIETLAEVQDRQQVTIKKLIKILKGVNTKIAHLYDEK
ncbi:MAG: hypothetical protein QM500_09000 [Methylococcales bacterium]